MKKNKKVSTKKHGKPVKRIVNSEFSDRLKGSGTLAEIFELVKDGVYHTMGQKRPGLMLGLTEIASNDKKQIGGFHPMGSNFILINKTPLKQVLKKNEKLYQPYVFHILLREYIHSFGVFDEKITSRNVKQISETLFGKTHIVTALSTKFNKFFPQIIYSDPSEYVNQENNEIEMVDNFDSSSAFYLK